MKGSKVMENTNNNYNNQKRFKNKKNKQKSIQIPLEESKTVDISKELEEINKRLEEKEREMLDNISSKINEQIEINVSKRMKEEEKRILKRKKGKIFRRNVCILVLICIIAYLVYCLYDINYLELKYSKQPETNISSNVKDNEEKVEPVKENKSQKYISEYGYLVDNMQYASIYKENVSVDTMPLEMKLQIAYNNLDKENINVEEETLSFKSKDLQNSFEKIFGKDAQYKNQNFEYNGSQYIYINGMYVSSYDESQNVDSNILYAIDNAYFKDEKLIFEVIVAKTEEGNLINIANNNIVVEDFDASNMNLLDYKNKLSKYKFVFSKNNKDYFFESIQNLEKRES